MSSALNLTERSTGITQSELSKFPGFIKTAWAREFADNKELFELRQQKQCDPLLKFFIKSYERKTRDLWMLLQIYQIIFQSSERTLLALQEYLSE
jgi:hypothetical protein